VIGEEVMTTAGEIIGLFLRQPVPPGLNPVETAARIKDQGGLVYVEHPYDTLRRHMTEGAIEEIAGFIDVVEVFNARSGPEANRRAEDLCSTLGAAAGAGSDAHSIREIGSVYVEMEDFDSAQDFLAKLRDAKIVKGRSKLLLAAEARLASRGRRT
jgi:predicted metal-dependent phosphoesterase TrpH